MESFFFFSFVFVCVCILRNEIDWILHLVTYFVILKYIG
jgi:hypothetical protein